MVSTIHTELPLPSTYYFCNASDSFTRSPICFLFKEHVPTSLAAFFAFEVAVLAFLAAGFELSCPWVAELRCRAKLGRQAMDEKSEKLSFRDSAILVSGVGNFGGGGNEVRR
jgi:hypothetical protein